ncbi:Lipoprotein [Ralstonia mannitolilytica]|nr:hypothetical protein VZ52_20330 [Ralstonia mannitolilytica]MBU9580838.1 hypothetical protein [Ralstonia mannitolilytica]CAJ0687099.1 hypothetical protein R82526_02926 [Ralstonia mannitolilytica]CAJ0804653.1 hypothetical protein R77555_04160 [Ralstonia mannitolilytica]
MKSANQCTSWGKQLMVGMAACLLSMGANAGESPFGWIYTADVMPKGRFEFEHQSLLQQGQSQGSYSGLLNREEIEYGVTDKFQLAGYFNWSYVNAKANGVDGTTRGPLTDLGPNDDPTGRYRKTRFETVSLEAIYQVLNPVTDPIGLALYLEPELGPRERDLEWRIILQKNMLDDRLIFAANILGAHERDKTAMGDIERASMLDLTAGVSYRFTDNLSLGAEARNHREFLGYRFDRRDHSAWFVGPNLHYATKHWWVTAAWRHQLPVVKTYNEDQAAVVAGHRIFGDEHARNEFIVKVGVPF